MERDLNFRKLVKMFFLNAWIIIIIGVICASTVSVLFCKEEQNTLITKKVLLVYNLEGDENRDLESIKNTYFDAYLSLLRGNILLDSKNFSDQEKERLKNISLEVSSSCYSLTLSVPNGGNIEKDKEVFNKYVEESELWMKKKFGDESIQVETVYENVEEEQMEKNVFVGAGIGFCVGVIMAAMFLFVWFVLDRKIRTEEDVVYYTGLKCIGSVKWRE